MPEESAHPDPAKPGWLLPFGCHELIDWLHLKHNQQLLQAWYAGKPKPVEEPPPPPRRVLPKPPPLLPEMLVLPASITVADLAGLLNLKAFQLIKALMDLNVYASLKFQIPFETAAAVCASLGAC